MSLVGNLEELGLGEILQLISLSRKTGVLSLHSRGREGMIVFKQGLVVKALSSLSRTGLGEVLVQRGVMDSDTLGKALALQKERGFSEHLGIILTKRFAVPHETIEEVVREQIEQLVLSLFSWLEGTFDFEPQENIEAIDGGIVDPLQFMLSKGLNPQFLAMEGTRVARESRAAVADHGGGTDEAEIPFDLSDVVHIPEIVPEPAAARPLVIVDDDGTTLKTLAELLRENGYEVHAMTSSEDTLIRVDNLHRGGQCPAVLVDLIMPRMDGSGVLGGIELLELLHNNFTDIPILMMTDYHHAEAEKRVSDMGYGCVMKPHRAECSSPESMRAFLPVLLDALRRSESHDAARG
ncbi:response regulator [Geobacter sp. FeAm09]|uniref:response regulator n=1 Tax=Geobacter sp. FeAm09 TaxID=2597769 RepID=UPI0011ED70CB|nr:response regulator [Geobacter sp. FeAm09]QEM68203.1 response regulator [Geobacter sp. FeAm09]